MSRPAPPAIDEIRHVDDARTFQRGSAYQRQRRVTAGTFTRSEITGTVRGRRPAPYEVEIELEQGIVISTWCSCPMGGWCKHVVAVLIEYCEHPDRWRPADGGDDQVAVPAGPDLSSAEATRRWAEDRGVADLLDRPAHTLIREPWLKNQTGKQTVIQALMEPLSRHGYYRDLGTRIRQILATALGHQSELRAQGLAYNASVRELRKRAPAEPALAALHAWLLPAARLDEVDYKGPVRPLIEASMYETADDPPTVRVLIHGLEMDEPVPLQPTDGAELPGVRAARAILDLLVHPELADSDVRAWAAKQAAIPPWRRALVAFERSLSKVSTPDPEGREVGWRVVQGHELTVQPVYCRPYKTKAGLRTWKRRHGDGPQLPQDAAASKLLADRYGYESRDRDVAALAALVGHPRVVLGKKGHHVAVREGALRVDWIPEDDGGVGLQLVLDGEPLGAATLARALEEADDTHLPFLQPARSRISVVRCPAASRALLNELARRPTRFPAEARTDVLERFAALSDLLPMRLVGELRGVEVDPDPRPLVRLLPGPDGAVEVDLRTRPLPDGPVCHPGRGPDTLAAVRDGQRVFVERDPGGEQRDTRALADALCLPEQDGFTWVLADPEVALPVIEALQERDDVQVEWVRPAVRVVGQVGASALKVQGVARRDWFGLEGGIEVDGQVADLAELLAAIRGGRRFVRVGADAWARITAELEEQLAGLAGVSWTSRKGVEMPPLASGVLEEVEAAGATVDLPKTWRVQQERIREAAGLHVPIPDGLQATLRGYQQVGYQWLARLAHWAPGAVLADDMGLGKTIQALCLLLRRAPAGPALVVAPASVGLNWLREAERFAPSLRARAYRGRTRARLLADLGPSDVLVTSWELMARDADALEAVGFHTVVLDEAQAIKNPATARSKASARLGAGFTLALTGTPVENRVGEVWSLFRTVVPGLFGPSERFRHGFIGPIERDGDRRARTTLAGLLRPFLLRRLKSEVATDLPERTEIELRIELGREERALYDELRLATVAALAAPSEEAGERFRILAAMTRLRQLACDGRLVHPDRGLGPSAKLQRLVHTLVDLKENGHRALVFSQFTTLLGLAREAVEAAGIKVRYLDGSTPVKRRQAEVDAFQAGDGDCFLISVKAGGTGLNLTAASYVIHLDPWWNPAVEDQATDRAHRIGQTQPVTVYRFVARDTIEEAVLALHAEKRALVADLLDGTSKAAALTPAELLGLLQGQPLVVEAAQKGDAPPDLLARLDALLEDELRSGALKREVTGRHYRKAAGRMLAWASAAGGAVTDPASLDRWSAAYLAALASGELAVGRSDKVFGPPAFRRLRALLEHPPG